MLGERLMRTVRTVQPLQYAVTTERVVCRP